MVSYMDVLTILLIFFLVAAKSLSKQEEDRRKAETDRKPETPTLQTEKPDAGSKKPLADLERKLADAGFDLKLEPRGLTISLPQAALFSPGNDLVRAEASPTLDRIAEALRSVPNQVNLAGHADAMPIHNKRFRSNWELAAARSLRLLELLTTRYGVEESRLSISSYGSNDPSRPNDTAEGRARNRRVEIVILAEPGAQ